MSQSIIRVYEAEPLPDFISVDRILATEEVPVGTGTNTRRMLTVLVTDCRHWLTDEEKRLKPL